MKQQLDLFEVRAERNVVVPFPIERQRQAVRDMVRFLEMREGKKRGRYWELTLRRMIGTMQVWRVDKAMIDREIRAFREAVIAEYTRQQIWGRPDDDRQGGAG